MVPDIKATGVCKGKNHPVALAPILLFLAPLTQHVVLLSGRFCEHTARFAMLSVTLTTDARSLCILLLRLVHKLTGLFERSSYGERNKKKKREISPIHWFTGPSQS